MRKFIADKVLPFVLMYIIILFVILMTTATVDIVVSACK